MRAEILDRFGGPLRIGEVPDPRPDRDGVVLRV